MIAITEKLVTAKIKFNFINKPSFYVYIVNYNNQIISAAAKSM